MFLALVAASALTGAARAVERYAFSAERFAAAQAEGKPILVDISATWCPVCKAQHKVIESALTKAQFAQFVIFDVDFDTEKSVVRQFGANKQSTLIVFKGKSETGRLVGSAETDKIEAVMQTAVE
jgi:thioredoxin-like negative regulator of GroEL